LVRRAGRSGELDGLVREVRLLRAGRGLSGERGDEDDPLGGRVLRVARGEGQAVVTEVAHDVGVLGVDDELLAHLVDEGALHRGDLDPVAGVQLVDVVERGAVGGAVPGDGGVAGLAGERAVLVVARPTLEVVQAHYLDDDLVDADVRDPDAGDGVALGRQRWRWGRLGRGGGRARVGRRVDGLAD